MKKEEFIKGMTLLGVAYNKGFTEEEISIWYQMLGDNTEEDFSKAVQDLIKTETYLPSIAHFTKQIAKYKTSDIPSAEDEWQEVLNAVRHYGSYKETEALKSLNPYTSKITQLIGYYRICTSNQEQQIWNKKEFIDEYNSLKDEYITDLQIGTKGVNLLNE